VEETKNPWRTVAIALVVASAVYITATYFMMY
jgi:hypothetical protein